MGRVSECYGYLRKTQVTNDGCVIMHYIPVRNDTHSSASQRLTWTEACGSSCWRSSRHSGLAPGYLLQNLVTVVQQQTDHKKRLRQLEQSSPKPSI